MDKKRQLDDELNRFEAELLREEGQNQFTPRSQSKPTRPLAPPPPPPAALTNNSRPSNHHNGTLRPPFKAPAMGLPPRPFLNQNNLTNNSGPPQFQYGPRPPFMPNQFTRPNGPPRPPFLPHFARPPMGLAAAAGPVLNKPASPSGPKVVYASEPTRYTTVIEPKSVVEKQSDFLNPTNMEELSAKRLGMSADSIAKRVTTTVTIEKKTPIYPDPSPASNINKKFPVSQNSKMDISKAAFKGKKDKKNKKNLRYAAGQVWEDKTLEDWEPGDYRMFAGDLGNDVTEEHLNRTFCVYPSFVKAKVVRDKHTNKSKGYGFLSFRDPGDYTRAMKEVSGRYVGSRPIKLRKSTWRDRGLENVLKKNKEKSLLGLK